MLRGSAAHAALESKHPAVAGGAQPCLIISATAASGSDGFC
jgi:hypothetical protein